VVLLPTTTKRTFMLSFWNFRGPFFLLLAVESDKSNNCCGALVVVGLGYCVPHYEVWFSVVVKTLFNNLCAKNGQLVVY